MPSLDRFVTTARVWFVTVIVYAGSIVAASAVMHFVDWGPAASAVAWIGLISVGPVLLALRTGLPAMPWLAALGALGALYFVAISLSSNTYDTDRWDYSHLRDGLFVLSVQALAATCAVVVARRRHRHRRTEFPPAASHLKYRTR